MTDRADTTHDADTAHDADAGPQGPGFVPYHHQRLPAAEMDRRAIEIEGLEWAMIVEIERGEIEQSIVDFLRAQHGDRVPVLLLDTDVEENHPADRAITSVLYIRGREMRLCQEILREAVGETILIHKYLPGYQLPTKVGRFDWTLGDHVKALREQHGADYALFRRQVEGVADERFARGADQQWVAQRLNR